MNALTRSRTFLLGAYHDLPNVLFTGSLVLGAITGYLPLVWVSLGLILNGATISVFQNLFSFLFRDGNGAISSQVAAKANSMACYLFSPVHAPMKGDAAIIVAPSHWLGATTFFAIFVIYNSLQVATRPGVKGASREKVDTRVAYSLSTLAIGILFFLLVLSRGFTQCETWLGSLSGVTIGIAIAIGFWHLLDACGAGTLPDILQVVRSMPPEGSGSVPIVCSPQDTE
jgi:hypothetical protein